MASPADQIAEARRDVARIGMALQDALDKQGIELTLVSLERALTELMHRDVIRVGARPNPERPMEGQLEMPAPFETEDVDWGVGP